jgi:RHS repeat-associated protein
MKTTTACTTTSGDETFTYDDPGNRLTAAGTSFSYDAQGQLASCNPGCGTITYDDTGRTASANGWTLSYDGEGRLASACRVAGCATGDMVTMRYDGEGRRVELVTRPNGGAAVTTTFRYQGSSIAQELTGGTLARTYLTDEAGTIVKVCDPDCTGANPAYLVTYNGHGDALALWRIESAGTLTLANSFSYSTWGTPTTATDNGYADLGFRFLYVGAHGVAWDNALGLGLLYMSARHYSPAMGRFLQPDPSALEANLYGYAENSPVTKTDPSGHAVAIAACFTPWTIKLCIDAGLVLVAATGAVIAFIVQGDTRTATVVTRTWTPPQTVRRDEWWRNVQVQLVKKTLLAERGSRYLDICEWNSVWAYLGSRFRPNQCWEIKSGDAAYLGTEQWRRDMEIMATFHFPIRYRRSWGIMEWP